MTKGWRIVDCTAMTGILRYKRGQLVIEHHDLETRIPFSGYSRTAFRCSNDRVHGTIATVGVLRCGSTHMPMERNSNSRDAIMG